MDAMNAEVARLFAAKAERRKALSRLPFPEKVRAVMKLQEMAAPILRARGRVVRVWRESEKAVSEGSEPLERDRM